MKSETDFPSSIASFSDPYFSQTDDYFLGQDFSKMCAASAQTIKAQPWFGKNYSAVDTIVNKYLNQVVFNGLDGTKAWNECISEVKSTLAKQ